MKAKIIHVQGNVLTMEIPLIRRSVVTVNARPEQTDTDFIPAAGAVIKVRAQRGFHTHDLDFEVKDNVIVVKDLGSLPVGTYALSVYYGDSEMRMRLRHPDALEIVNNTADGGIYRSGEYDSDAQFLTVNNRVSAIVITDDAVFMEVGGGLGADEDPDDDEVTAYTDYGEGYLEVSDDEVTLFI